MINIILNVKAKDLSKENSKIYDAIIIFNVKPRIIILF